MPILPEKPTLAEWQDYVRRWVEERHFATDPNLVFIRFAEEVGELAKEMRKRQKLGTAAVTESAGGELADVLFYLLDLANHFGVDLEDAARTKLAINADREWKY